MSKNTSFILSFGFKIATRLAIVLLCVSSSLVFSDISWAKKPTQEEIKNLIEKLNTNDEWEREKTIEELREIGKDEIPSLVKVALEEESLLIRIGIKEALESSDYKIIIAEKLITALEYPDVKIRRRASKWLNNISRNLKLTASQFVPRLTKLLNHNNSDVQSSAAIALGNMGDKAASDEVIKLLIKLLNDNNSHVQSSAAIALGSMGDKAANDEVIKLLIKLLNNNNSDVRSNAARALGNIGEKAATDEVIQILSKLLNDEDFLVQSKAAYALGNIAQKATTDEVIKVLTKLLNEKDSSEQISNAYALVNIAVSIQDKAQEYQLSVSDFNKLIPKLEKALKKIKNSEKDFSKPEASLRRSLLVIKEKRNAIFWHWLFKNPLVIIPSVYLVFFPSLWFILLRLKPILLIEINEILKPYEFCFPKELGGVPVKTRDLLLFSFFKFRPRVLDAWVKKNIGSIPNV